MDLKKQSFIEAYQKSFGNVSQSCKASGISRQTFYNWKEEDSEFLSEIVNVEPEEVFIDFAENALAKKISEGDTTAIIFALKTKGKKRGYVERQEFNHQVNQPIFQSLDIDVITDDGNGQDKETP
jgi:hypothetical protein